MADEKHSKREAGGDLEVEDLDVEATADGSEQVKGGATRVQGTVKWIDESTKPAQP